MKIEKKEKLQRYLIEALHKSQGCNSATCEMREHTDGSCGTAVLCRCGYVVETMVRAANQVVCEGSLNDREKCKAIRAAGQDYERT
jgi:hypothetical protein